MSYMWDIFVAIRNTLPSNEPMRYSEVEAYSRLSGIKVTPLEVKILFKMDREWLSTKAKGA